MKSVSVLFLLAIAAISACNSSRQNNDSKELFTALSDSAQAISLMGDTLYPSSPYANGSSKYDTAKMNYQASPDNVDNIDGQRIRVISEKQYVFTRKEFPNFRRMQDYIVIVGIVIFPSVNSIGQLLILKRQQV
jgi:hypothetical protein